MKTLTTAVCLAFFALTGASAYAADKPAADTVAAKAADKAASAAADKKPAAKKKEKKGGC